jgi:hypothetical protein
MITEKLIEQYKNELQDRMYVSLNLKELIDSSKTNVKKRFYTKKLHKNNKICAKIAFKLEKILKMSEKDNDQN